MYHYTSIEQSKKLLELGLNLESADMFCADVFDKEKETHSYNFHILSTWGCNTFEELKDRENKFLRFIPCWSIGALMELMPMVNGREPHLIWTKGTYTCFYYCGHRITKETMIEAAYNMVVWLLENNHIKERK